MSTKQTVISQHAQGASEDFNKLVKISIRMHRGIGAEEMMNDKSLEPHFKYLKKIGMLNYDSSFNYKTFNLGRYTKEHQEKIRGLGILDIYLKLIDRTNNTTYASSFSKD